jgi:hypothetical protein
MERCNSSREDVQIVVDVLSLIGVHMLLQSNPLIGEKLAHGDALTGHYGALLGFLEVGNFRVRETALKIAIAAQNARPNSKNSSSSDKTSLRRKRFFWRLLHKLLEQSRSVINNKLCQVLFDLLFWVPEKISYLYPTHSSVVCTILNRSEHGAFLQKQEK